MLSSLKVDGNAVDTALSYTITNVQKATTITAEFSPISYTISYNLDGGTGSNPTSFTVETESFTLNEPTREGYTFTGWTGSNGTTAQKEVTIAKGSTGDRSYTANWEKILVYTDTSGANKPVLAEGLTPVNWDIKANNWEGGWVDANISGTWDYNYNSVANVSSNGTTVGNGNGKWANAMTDDGSLYVWIPRYTYKVTGLGTNGNSHNSDLYLGNNKVEIKFSNGINDDIDGGYYFTHPAFTFGDDELKGIWVAKYEASQGTTADEVSIPTSSTSVAKSIPGVSSWRDLNVNKIFDSAFNTYRNADSHLMKNVEWGAVAYLTSAIGRIPYINNNYITGKAGADQNSSIGTTSYAWNEDYGVRGSTTHNVYGIYDMSGGVYEYVSAYYTVGSNSNMTQLINASDKYVDRYSDIYTNTKKGDAIYETSSNSSGNNAWDNDYSEVPNSNYPIFLRGGIATDEAFAGIFSFSKGNGEANVGTFRVVLAPKN